MSTPIIEVRDLSFRYPGADTDTLRNVNLTIERGDFVAVVGGNGSGKTTLCKTFNGLVPHYWQGEFAGSVHVDGIDTWNSSVSELSTRVGYVYQDFQNQLVRPTVRDEVAFAPLNFGLADYDDRTSDALDALGIEALAERFIWQLSGGQAHLTALASVLAMRPSVVIVDEPVAELDPARAHEVYRRLTELNAHGITVITIEHHAEFIAEYARSVVLMSEGTPVWHLPVEDAVNRTEELEGHGIPAPEVIVACRALGAKKAPRSVQAAADFIRENTREDAWKQSIRVPATQRDTSEVVLSAREVNHSRKGVGGKAQPILRGLNVDLYQGDRVALVGGNGAGKTTLLRILAGLDVPRSGTIEVAGVNTRSRSAARMANLVSYLYQTPSKMFLRDSIEADIRLFPAGRKADDVDELVEKVLTRVRLNEFADRDGRTLSGGQQRRAALAIGLAMRPSVLLLDEPTSSLDIASRDDVTDLLNELSDSIACSVVATHDMHLVSDWASRVLVLADGHITADLTPADLFADTELLARTNLVPPQIVRLGSALGLDPPPLNVADLVKAVRTSAVVEA